MGMGMSGRKWMLVTVLLCMLLLAILVGKSELMYSSNLRHIFPSVFTTFQQNTDAYSADHVNQSRHSVAITHESSSDDIIHRTVSTKTDQVKQNIHNVSITHDSSSDDVRYTLSTKTIESSIKDGDKSIVNGSANVKVTNMSQSQGGAIGHGVNKHLTTNVSAIRQSGVSAEIRLPSVVLSLRQSWTNVTHVKSILASPRLGQGRNNGATWRLPMFLNAVKNLLRARLDPTLWKQLDLMKYPPFKLDQEFRNPCWRSNTYLTNSCSNPFITKSKPREPISNLRCLPYFLIIGEVKCGTTDLWERLVRHPDIAVGPLKELQWIGRMRVREYPGCTSMDSYFRMLQIGTEEILQKHQPGVRNPYITGEGTPDFFSTNEFWDLLPGNENATEPRLLNVHYLHHLNPGAKIILSLRNPVNRLRSHYIHWQKIAKRRPTTSDFHETVKQGIERFNKCLETRTLRACCYDYTLFDYLTLKVDLSRGIYHVFLEDWLKVYPREQIHIHRFEDYAANRTEIFSQLYNFLGIRNLPLGDLEKFAEGEVMGALPTMKQSMGPMWNITRQLLEAFYEPYNRKLAAYLNDRTYLWYLQQSNI